MSSLLCVFFIRSRIDNSVDPFINLELSEAAVVATDFFHEIGSNYLLLRLHI